MKKNGEENWKKKVPKVEITKTVTTGSIIENNANIDKKNGNEDSIIHDNHNNDTDLAPCSVTLRDKKPSVNRPGGKVGSLQERMSLLQTAQNSWQNKVGEKDVDKFTVAGKMGGSTPNKRPSRKESEMNAVNESHQQTVNILCFEVLDSG